MRPPSLWERECTEADALAHRVAEAEHYHPLTASEQLTVHIVNAAASSSHQPLPSGSGPRCDATDPLVSFRHVATDPLRPPLAPSIPPHTSLPGAPTLGPSGGGGAVVGVVTEGDVVVFLVRTVRVHRLRLLQLLELQPGHPSATHGQGGWSPLHPSRHRSGLRLLLLLELHSVHPSATRGQGGWSPIHPARLHSGLVDGVRLCGPSPLALWG